MDVRFREVTAWARMAFIGSFPLPSCRAGADPIADIQRLRHNMVMGSPTKVFLVYFELGSASAPFRERGYAGGFVTCIVPRNDLRSAIDAGEAALVEDGYEVLNIDKALTYEPEEWEHDEEVKRAVAECRQSKEVSYSDFNIWGH